MDGRPWLVAGSISGLIAVAAGAFGAHGLRARISPDLLQVFETGARYQMYHALALLAAGFLAGRAARAATAAGVCFIAGTVLFSGSLYAMALTGERFWGAVTPLGGTAFLLGWGFLAIASLGRSPKHAGGADAGAGPEPSGAREGP